MEKLEQLIFQLITKSGSARSNAFEAFQCVKNNELDMAKKKMETAEQEILAAHQIQTSLIQKEAKGEELKVNILLVHAQDHLMTSILAKDLIEEMIDMQKEINYLNKR